MIQHKMVIQKLLVQDFAITSIATNATNPNGQIPLIIINDKHTGTIIDSNFLR